MTKGAELAVAERDRQITEEGFTPELDAGKWVSLTEAGVAYAQHTMALHANGVDLTADEVFWPWAPEYFKPVQGDEVGTLVKAAALIIAAIDSLLIEDKNVENLLKGKSDESDSGH